VENVQYIACHIELSSNIELRAYVCFVSILQTKRSNMLKLMCDNEEGFCQIINFCMHLHLAEIMLAERIIVGSPQTSPQIKQLDLEVRCS